MGPKVKLQLFGILSIVSESGENLTPKSAKACGLLALLAASPDMRRPRRWLEDKLWSDRGPDQASASLRQTLSQLRRTFKSHNGLLLIDRKSVRLHPDFIEVDRTAPDGPSGPQFLEGLDIRDPEFENWLREQRQYYENQTTAPALPMATPSKRLMVRSRFEGPGSDMARFLADVSSVQLAQNICEQTGAHCVIDSAGPALAEDVDIEVFCQAVEHADRHSVAVKVYLARSGLVLHNKIIDLGHSTVDYLSSDPLARAMFESSDQVLRKLPAQAAYLGADQTGAAMVQQAIGDIFSFNKAALERADTLLMRAFVLDKNPAMLAWRALIRNIQAIELPNEDVYILKQEADQLIEEALRLDGDNSFIMSLAALTRVMLFEDPAGAMDLARPAMEANPNSAFALQSISMAHMVSGNTTSAYLISKRSHFIAGGSKYGYWWDLFHCLACIAARRFDEALPLAHSAARRAPGFRPPLRALIALHGHRGEPAEAKAAAARLQRIESRFTMQRFLEDSSYPNNTARAAGLLDMPHESLAELRAS